MRELLDIKNIEKVESITIGKSSIGLSVVCLSFLALGNLFVWRYHSAVVMASFRSANNKSDLAKFHRNVDILRLQNGDKIRI